MPGPSAELFFKPPEFTAPAISPDGKNIAFIAQNNGHACLFRMDLKTGQVSGIFSAGEGDVETFWWAGSQRVLIAGDGEEGLEYFVQDLGGSRPRPVPILKGAPTKWVIIPRDAHDHVFALNFWREAYLARIDLESGHSSKVESFISDFDYTVVSANGELRAKIWQNAGQWHVAWRASAKEPWHSLESSNQDWPAFEPAGMAADDRHLLVYAYDQGNTIALMSLDPVTDQRTLVAQRPDRDAYGLFREGPSGGQVGAKFFSNAREDLVFFDDTARSFSAALDQSLPGMIHYVTSASDDGSLRIIRAWLPGYPSRYYLFDAGQRRLSLLGDQRPDLKPGALGEVEYFQFQTRDGVTESGYLVRPQRDNDARPVPLIVMGMHTTGERIPVASDFRPEDQYFASRGYGVAHFAVRGTTGFGRAFEKAGDFQLGGKIVQDFEDGVAHLAKVGAIDPKRVAVMGYGRGGLFALRAAAGSHAFQAVVAYNAPCDLTNTAISWLSSSIAEIPVVVTQAGGTKAAYELLHQFEPESFMDTLSVPVLLGYSSWFGHTSLADEAAKIRSSFDRRHKAYEWYQLDYRRMHSVKGEAYDIEFYTKVADYLDKTLR